ncbi:hypothetical protein [Tumebacillus flagellatus]|uniref:Uncharacterized protein n=1 Tax=Tumebacillus flagellatus TaxID=1157490 RepID=A0A074LNG0_9BACL|nr:hypothetical protein [Tumebacillus flagellatus]KEO81398.1 hypothetical protein EL26_20910 [Tumebacillus flagellatus]
MTKSLKKVDERLMAEKVYNKSQVLHKSISIIDDRQIDKLLEQSEMVYQASFESDYYGKITYQRRKIKSFKKKHK